jgi:hypothetical protein
MTPTGEGEDKGPNVSKRDPMSVVGSATLLLETIVVALAIPLALRTEVAQQGLFIGLCVGSIAVSVLATATMRKPLGVWLGWLAQILLFGASFLLPAMIFVAVVFTALWVTAIWVAGRVRRARS